MRALNAASHLIRNPGRNLTMNAVKLLKADHQEVAALFEKFESLDDEEKGDTAEQICQMLTVHAQIEEELLYPAAREALTEDDADLVDEATVEHASVKDLVSQIESGDPADDLFDAKVKVLGEYVTHHVKEEEGELFPKLEKTDLDLDVLGTELAERKQELMSALADDAGNVPPTPAKSKKGGNRTSPNR
jgi:hemerythrin superfamily protein